jgi:hypothetical protein
MAGILISKKSHLTNNIDLLPYPKGTILIKMKGMFIRMIAHRSNRIPWMKAMKTSNDLAPVK